MSDSSDDSDSDASETLDATLNMRLRDAIRKAPVQKRRRAAKEPDSSEPDSDNSEDSDSDEEGSGGEGSGEEGSEGEASLDEHGAHYGKGGKVELSEEDAEEIEVLQTMKGKTIFRCRFCPGRGPFNSLEDCKNFMTGKYYLGVVKRVLKEAKGETKKEKAASYAATAAAEGEETEEAKAKREAKREAKKAEGAKRKEEFNKKKAESLSAAQIEKRKLRFQLKKQRRLEARGEKPKEALKEVTTPVAPAAAASPPPTKKKPKNVKAATPKSKGLSA
jgi:hypothetical protein